MIDIEKIKLEKGEKCWLSIGVFGSGICELLDEYNHCKNCPVYALGGRQLLEREVSPEMINEWTSIISLPKEIESSNKISLVIFRIADEWLGINTNIFQEAVVQRFIHFVPARTNDYFHGIINVNGELLMCISLAKLINLPFVSSESENSKSKKFKNLLVIFDKYTRFAFPVDEFFGVASVSKDNMTEPPLTVSKADLRITDSIINLKNRRVAIINDKKLFSMIEKKVVW
jgi:chemotaxis-related protein WspD